MDFSAIRADLQDRLERIPDLTVYTVLPASPEVPCVVLHPAQTQAHTVMSSDAADVRFDVQVLVQLADWESAQDQLDAYATQGEGSPMSIIDALETDATVVVETIGNYGTVALGGPGGTEFGSATFSVLVMV